MRGNSITMKNNPYNTPLTLDELSKMGGKLVYIADYDGYAIVNIEWVYGDRKVYLYGSRYDKERDVSFEFNYDVELHDFKIYRCPIKFEQGLKPYLSH